MQDSASRRGVLLGSLLRRGVLLAVLWWILSEGRPDSWLPGVIAVAAGLWASLRLAPASRTSLRIAALPRFVVFFIQASLKGGMQVALLALRPGVRLQPAMQHLPLTLPPGYPRTLMTAALCLMPGTVGVRLQGDVLRIHVLDERLAALAGARTLEQHVARLFGAGP